MAQIAARQTNRQNESQKYSAGSAVESFTNGDKRPFGSVLRLWTSSWLQVKNTSAGVLELQNTHIMQRTTTKSQRLKEHTIIIVCCFLSTSFCDVFFQQFQWQKLRKTASQHLRWQRTPVEVWHLHTLIWSPSLELYDSWEQASWHGSWRPFSSEKVSGCDLWPVFRIHLLPAVCWQ